MLTKETQEKADCRINRNRNGRGTRRSETGYMDQSQRKIKSKDDDRNGLIDDINGWNFLGGKDAQVVESLTREGEREFFRLKDKYADYILMGKVL